MDMIKKFFPFSFNFKEKDINGLVVSIIVYLVAGLVAGLVLGLLGKILAVIKLDIIVSILGFVVGLYCLAGIVFAVLKFCDVLK